MSKSVGELRAELKALRKEHPDHMPVSKMKKTDISDVIERMKGKSETIPTIALDKETRSVASEKAKEKKELKEPKEHKMVKDVKVKKDHKEKPVESHKESVAERMARVRSMKGKKKE
jgi:hypothetical protein